MQACQLQGIDIVLAGIDEIFFCSEIFAVLALQD
jgi:hypothetical protein